MTGRHTRHIVLTVLATVVLSAASCASQEPRPQELTREEIENLGIDDLFARAEQGNALAQFNLGVNYTSGEGVPQDDVLAHKWFNLAAAQGDASAKKNRAIVTDRMTREQIAEAQRLAREWKPKTWDELKK